MVPEIVGQESRVYSTSYKFLIRNQRKYKEHAKTHILRATRRLAEQLAQMKRTSSSSKYLPVISHFKAF